MTATWVALLVSVMGASVAVLLSRRIDRLEKAAEQQSRNNHPAKGTNVLEHCHRCGRPLPRHLPAHHEQGFWWCEDHIPTEGDAQ